MVELTQCSIYHFSILIMTLILHSCIGSGTDNVMLSPAKIIQVEGYDAHFHCSIIGVTAYALNWMVNNSDVSQAASSDISVDGSGTTSTLTILALARYNGTALKCGALVYDTGYNTIWSRTSFLQVQGVLSHVRNASITRDATHIISSWLPPFTLNLTSIEPDIVYCVNVFLIHNEVRTHKESNCSIYTTKYSFTSDNLEDEYYEITITPRSNVNGVNNGSAHTVLGPLPTETECAERITAGLRQTVQNFEIYESTTNKNIRVNSNDERCDFNISNIDNTTLTMCSLKYSIICKLKGSNSNCTHALVLNMHYIAKGHCYNSHGMWNTLLLVPINTHELQEVDIRSMSLDSLDVMVTCRFLAITGELSTAGCFMVALSLEQDAPPLYRIAYTENDMQMNSNFTIRGGGMTYAAYFYELGRNQFPGQYPVLTQTVDIVASKDNQTIGSGTKLEVRIRSRLVCMKCNSSTENCLVIYHGCFYERQPLRLFLTMIYANQHNIHSESCVTLSPGCYWVAVFGLDVNGRMEKQPIIVDMIQTINQEMGKNMSTKNELYKKKNSIKKSNAMILVVVAATLSVLVLFAITVWTISVVFYRCYQKPPKKDKDNKNEFELEACAAYDVTPHNVQSQYYREDPDHIYSIIR